MTNNEFEDRLPMTGTLLQHILFVDDDQRSLDDLHDTLGTAYNLHRVRGVEQGLTALERQGPFAVVVADYNMRGMDGARFLARVRQLSPDAVRLMLVAREDYETAIAAATSGQIFCFLARSCSPGLFAAGLKLAVQQHKLDCAEKTLFEHASRGNIQVLSDMLCLANPEAFHRAARVQGYVRYLVQRFDLSPSWQYEAAGLLSQLGCVSLPQEMLARFARGEKLTDAEKRALDRHPQTGYRVLKRIPGLEEVAEMVFHQRGLDKSAVAQASASVTTGSRILAAVIGFDDLLATGIDKKTALKTLQQRNVCDPEILMFLARIVSNGGQQMHFRALATPELSVGMVLDQDVVTNDGSLLITRGEEVTARIRTRLSTYARRGAIAEPIHVRIPAAAPQ